MQMSPEVAQELDGACKCCMILRTSAHSGYPHLQDDFVAWWLGVKVRTGIGRWLLDRALATAGTLGWRPPRGSRRSKPRRPTTRCRWDQQRQRPPSPSCPGTCSAAKARTGLLPTTVRSCICATPTASAIWRSYWPIPAGSSMPSTWRPPTRKELEAEVDEAEAFNDLARATNARAELDFLVAELARAVGLGGRDRRAASHAERARLNVTRAIRAAMVNLARENPSLGRHLAATIRTGRYCSYTPDPHAPITWDR